MSSADRTKPQEDIWFEGFHRLIIPEIDDWDIYQFADQGCSIGAHIYELELNAFK